MKGIKRLHPSQSENNKTVENEIQNNNSLVSNNKIWAKNNSKEEFEE